MRYRQAPRARGVFYPDDEGLFFFPLVHVFRDDELDELIDAIHNAAFCGYYTDDEHWHAVADILRNHGR